MLMMGITIYSLDYRGLKFSPWPGLNPSTEAPQTAAPTDPGNGFATLWREHKARGFMATVIPQDRTADQQSLEMVFNCFNKNIFKRVLGCYKVG